MSDKRKEKKEKREKTENEYKRITRSLQAISRNEEPKKVQEIITDHLIKGDEYYPIVKKQLSGSASDGKHLRNLVQLSTEAAKRINSASKTFDMKKVIFGLKREHGNKLTEFIAVEHVNDCLMVPPTYEFFYGAIKHGELIVKERRKRAKVEIVAKTAVTATERNLASNDIEQDSTPKEVELIFKKIRGLCRERPDSAKYFTTIIDPNSFTQTVENIFHTSFLIKEGKVGVKKGQGNVAMLTYEEGNQTQDRKRVSRQSILSFSMADYNRWKAKKR